MTERNLTASFVDCICDAEPTVTKEAFMKIGPSLGYYVKKESLLRFRSLLGSIMG